MQMQVIVGQRRAQTRLDDPLGLHPVVHLLFEERECAAAFFLRPVEREIGILEELIGGVAIVGRERDADAGANGDSVLADFIRRGDGSDDPARNGLDVSQRLNTSQNDGEFIAAKTGHGIHSARIATEPRGHGFQQFITNGMAERIIDGFEAVEIEAEESQRFAALNAPKSHPDAILKKQPVRQPSEAIVVSELRDHRLVIFALGDIEER